MNLGELMGANPTLPDLICMSIAINLVFYKILLHHIRDKIDKYSNFYIKSLDETSYCNLLMKFFFCFLALNNMYIQK